MPARGATRSIGFFWAAAVWWLLDLAEEMQDEVLRAYDEHLRRTGGGGR